ncbi:MAG: hypothetical protein LRS48_03820 [Desulfurococcales archaeon]|nr:hypothetical protein [Desulfurococcales archaeon]
MGQADNSYELLRHALNRLDRREREDLSLMNVKFKRRLSAAAHFFSVAYTAARIVEAACERGRCPSATLPGAVAIAFSLGFVHDYAKVYGDPGGEKLLRKIILSARDWAERMGASDEELEVINDIAENQNGYAVIGETGVPIGGAGYPLHDTIRAAIVVSDLLASMESLGELLTGHQYLFRRGASTPDTYGWAKETLERAGIGFTYINVPENTPHKAVLAAASASIAVKLENMGCKPLLSYPDGLLLIDAPGGGVSISRSEIVDIIEKTVASGLLDLKTARSSLERYATRESVRLARVVLAALLLSKGLAVDEVYKILFPDDRDKEKRMEKLEKLARFIGSKGKEKLGPNDLAGIAGGNISHGRNYIESLQASLLVGREAEEYLLKAAENAFNVSTMGEKVLEKAGVTREEAMSAFLIVAASKNPEYMARILESLGVKLSRKPSRHLDLLLVAVEHARNIDPKTLAARIIQTPPVESITVSEQACKLAEAIRSPLVSGRCSGNGRKPRVTCLLCGMSVPEEESKPLSSVKNELQNSGMFKGFESWSNMYPPFSKVDSYINNRSIVEKHIRICTLCYYEIKRHLAPPRMEIVLGPPIPVGVLRYLSKDVVIKDAGPVVDLFGARILVPLIMQGRPIDSLKVTVRVDGSEYVLFDKNSGDTVKALLSRLSYARVFPLYVASPVYRAFLGGEPRLVTGISGGSYTPNIPDVEALPSLYSKNDEAYRGLLRLQLRLYDSVSLALRGWSAALSGCTDKRAFPRLGRTQRSGLLLDLVEHLTVYRVPSSGGKPRVFLPFSIASLGARHGRVEDSECRRALFSKRSMSSLGSVLYGAYSLEKMLRGVGVEVGSLVKSLMDYSRNVKTLLRRIGKSPAEVSPHEVSSMLRGIDDAVRNYAIHGDKELAVDLAAAKATQRLVQVYHCNPQNNDVCRNIVYSVRSVAEEVISMLEDGSLRLGEASRMLKDIYHISYYYYVIFRDKGQESPVEANAEVA